MRKLLSLLVVLFTVFAIADGWDSVIKKSVYSDSGLIVCYEVLFDDVKIADGLIKISWGDLSGKSQDEKDIIINSKVFEESEKVKNRYSSILEYKELEGYVVVKNGKDLNGDDKKIKEEKFTIIKKIDPEIFNEVVNEPEIPIDKNLE